MERKLQRTNKNQFFITIPKDICEIKKLNAGDVLNFSITDTEIIIKKRGLK